MGRRIEELRNDFRELMGSIAIEDILGNEPLIDKITNIYNVLMSEGIERDLLVGDCNE